MPPRQEQSIRFAGWVALLQRARIHLPDTVMCIFRADAAPLQVWAGNPAKMLRKLEEEEAGFIAQAANDYAALAAVHAVENGKTMEEILVRP